MHYECHIEVPHLLVFRQHAGHEAGENQRHDQDVGPLHDLRRQELPPVDALEKFLHHGHSIAQLIVGERIWLLLK